ncbi:YqeG family HAD IIIA-type phosphatase [Fructobacillus ficulneus]|uniref:HAD superfamily hydrolase n=1 Tax=Fructobacillus ficulneus TaxID=157463 RepID=A0A0K8MGS1_9LACO|nr:YqeG family HAD IIIA-type phosphatase [Fructobacillus ficulneus]GAO99756.1 HAD superfamily hydrolase [Fructobacillus ficulneus]
MALNFLKPTYSVESVYDLSVAELKAQGIKAVLTDLDNTLLAWNNPDGTPELHQWLSELKSAGIEVVVVSNNTWDRVEKAVSDLDVEYTAWSLKPLPRGILKVLKQNQWQKDEVLMVGDQMLTDVWAAHLAGVPSVLVKQLIESDMWQTWLNRSLEKLAKKIIYRKNETLIWHKSFADAVKAKEINGN